MRIELHEKSYWAGRVEASIKFIADYQAEQDRKTEAGAAAYYDSRSPLRRWFFGPSSREVDTSFYAGNWWKYPSCYGEERLVRLQQMLRALTEPNVGVIHLDDADYDAIRKEV